VSTWVELFKAGPRRVDGVSVERPPPDEPQNIWDVPFFGEAVVASATLREQAAGVRAAPAPPPEVARSRRPGASTTSVWPLIAVALVTIVAIVLRTHASMGAGPLESWGLGNAMPPPTSEEARAPLGHPAPVAFPSGSYQFVRHQSGSPDPVTYDPCRPIHYVVNPAREPMGAAGSVRSAIAAVSSATGLTFVDDGTTTESYSNSRSLYQPDRYGKRWAPVLIDFTGPADNPLFTTGPVGVGGSSYVGTSDGHLTFVTGAVDVDAEEAARLVADPRQVLLSAVLEHELGHVVGLAHVDDITQLMYPSAGHGIASYGSGDLTGLAQLGRGRCEPRL
jgi:hypothetical protein